MNIFSKVPISKPQRNVFNLSHEKKLTTDFGKLVPIFVQDLVPGDTFSNTSEIFVRFAPMLAPIMHRVNVFTHFFFVPNRLVMKNWTDYITGNDTEANLPVFDPMLFSTYGRPAGGYAPYADLAIDGSLADYMGLPTVATVEEEKSGVMPIQVLPFLAYQLIYNEYYRDQNLQDPIDLDYDSWTVLSESDFMAKYAEVFRIRSRAWEKDYFTSALPWAQKGPAVQIPGSGSMGLSGKAPVVYAPPPDGPFGPGDGHTALHQRGGNPMFPVTPGEGVIQGPTSGENYTPDSGRSMINFSNGTTLIDVDPNGNLFADLDNVQGSRDPGDTATGNTINDLRTAFQIQKWLEKNARAGTRYIEQILSHFGVRTPDSRLQRPEFIGGGKAPVVISEVLQTSESTQQSPQANMAGHGVSAAANNSFHYKALEHGYIIGLMSIQPRTAYQQGVPRHFLRNDKFDFFWPTLAHLGEQPVYNGELYWNMDPVTPGVPDNRATFGYQSRYSEYKYIPSTVHGYFRNNLEFWHLGRKFDALPQLNEDFIKVDNENTPDGNHRIFAVTDTENQPLWIQIYNKCNAVRPIPRYSEPGFVDHF